MQSALESAMGLPSRSTSAARMLAFVTPPEVRSNFTIVLSLLARYRPRMAVIESSCRIEEPPSFVFDTVADPRSELRWNPKVRVMEKTTDGPIDVGTTFRAKWTKSPLVELQITRWERPVGWSYVNGGPLEVALSITLEELDGGRATVLRSRFDAQPRGPLRLVFPVLLASLRREEANNMRLVKSYVESSASHGS